MHLLGQDLGMPLHGLVLESSKILESESWNTMHIVQNQHVSYQNVDSP